MSARLRLSVAKCQLGRIGALIASRRSDQQASSVAPQICQKLNFFLSLQPLSEVRGLAHMKKMATTAASMTRSHIHKSYLFANRVGLPQLPHLEAPNRTLCPQELQVKMRKALTIFTRKSAQFISAPIRNHDLVTESTLSFAPIVPFFCKKRIVAARATLG